MTAYFLRLYTCSVEKISEVTKIFKFFYFYQKFFSISFFIRIKSRTFITPSSLKSIQSAFSSIPQRYLIIDTISFAPYFLGAIAFRSGSWLYSATALFTTSSGISSVPDSYPSIVTFSVKELYLLILFRDLPLIIGVKSTS